MPMSKRDIDRLLSEANVAVVAVTAPDGAPHAVPTWYEYKKGVIVFHTAPSAFKYKCLQHDPRVTLCVDTRKAPYKAVIAKGRVSIEIKKDDARIRRMAVAYLGKRQGEAYAKTIMGEELAVVSFKPDRLISWDYGKESP
ncbi:MAG TPA: pyridoxamine 5'-phosphate oxidase family protein [Candidatus Binataceae bacterium]|nr:pyridoxamine 5'-phosphate oxidase family protein [Candidatus Binataceae bacterium]